MSLRYSRCGPAGQARPASPATPAYAEPGIAPDGSEIAFVSGGDIWTVPAAGGEARLLVSNAANDTRPVFSPDKTKLAFVSTRTGGGDIYVLTLATGDLERVTYDDGMDQLDGWSRDGKWLYFFSNGHDLSGGMNDVYRVSADGGTPMAVSGDRYANEFFSARRARRHGCSRSPRAGWHRASGGDTATVISTKRRSGCAI